MASNHPWHRINCLRREEVVGNLVVLGEQCDSAIHTRDSRASEWISETPRLVNTPEKVTLLKFSIRRFGSVSVLGSQIPSLRELSAF